MNAERKKYKTTEAQEAWSRVGEPGVDYGKAIKRIIKSKSRKSVPDKNKKVR